MKTKVAIIGYGNLGKGVEVGLTKTNDMELLQEDLKKQFKP